MWVGKKEEEKDEDMKEGERNSAYDANVFHFMFC